MYLFIYYIYIAFFIEKYHKALYKMVVITIYITKF